MSGNILRMDVLVVTTNVKYTLQHWITFVAVISLCTPIDSSSPQKKSGIPTPF